MSSPITQDKISAMNVVELKRFLKEKGEKGYSRLNRVDLVERAQKYISVARRSLSPKDVQALTRQMGKMKIQEIKGDVVPNIMSYLSLPERTRLRRVSKAFKEADELLAKHLKDEFIKSYIDTIDIEKDFYDQYYQIIEALFDPYVEGPPRFYREEEDEIEEGITFPILQDFLYEGENGKNRLGMKIQDIKKLTGGYTNDNEEMYNRHHPLVEKLLAIENERKKNILRPKLEKLFENNEFADIIYNEMRKPQMMDDETSDKLYEEFTKYYDQLNIPEYEGVYWLDNLFGEVHYDPIQEIGIAIDKFIISNNQ